jgi:hypothetical protein
MPHTCHTWHLRCQRVGVSDWCAAPEEARLAEGVHSSHAPSSVFVYNGVIERSNLPIDAPRAPPTAAPVATLLAHC